MYKPLNSKSAEIRILHLHPGSYSEDIKCTLSVSTTTSSFEALSYVWGSSIDSVNIEVEGESCPLTKNLEAALRHLRSENNIRSLWVDAICINQNDNDERKQQVAIMDIIYYSAHTVIAWLGAEEITAALDLIRKIAQAPECHWDMNEDTRADQNSFIGLIHLYVLLRDTEWFQRIWTVQEAVLARSIVYVYGSCVFDKGEINTLVQSFNSHFIQKGCCNLPTRPVGHMDRQVGPMFDKISTMIDILEKSRTSMPFLEIASKFRYRKATDPRDKIFGILGLTQDLTKDIIDYDSPVSAVYARATVQLIQNTRNLDVLSHVLRTHPQNDTATPKLPSWCPNWEWDYRNQYWRLDSAMKRQRFSNFSRHVGMTRHRKNRMPLLTLNG